MKSQNPHWRGDNEHNRAKGKGMKFKIMLYCSILFAVALGGVTASRAWACVPSGDETLSCIFVHPARPKVTAAVTTVKATPAPVAVVSAAHGTGPSDAPEAKDAWETIGPNTTVWYKIGGGIDRQHLDVWLDAYGKPSISFAVYSPEQMSDWSPATPPKGRGASNRADPSHDLFWTGQAPAGGTWYVVVTNGNAAALPFKVGYNRVLGGREGCGDAYWEYFPNGAYVLWPGYCK
jgi:hypothetical protein